MPLPPDMASHVRILLPPPARRLELACGDTKEDREHHYGEEAI